MISGKISIITKFMDEGQLMTFRFLQFSKKNKEKEKTNKLDEFLP